METPRGADAERRGDWRRYEAWTQGSVETTCAETPKDVGTGVQTPKANRLKRFNPQEAYRDSGNESM